MFSDIGKIAFALLFMLADVPVQAETVSIVDATGLVVNDPENVLDTHRLALIEAQKEAVSEVVGIWLESHSTVNKAILEKNRIETETEGRVRSYRILSEGPKGKLYRLQIRAVVDLNGKRFSEQSIVTDALLNINSNKLYGALTLLNGVRPTEEALRAAIADPIPIVSAYVDRVASQAPGVDRITLLSGVAQSLGLPHTGANIVFLEKFLEEHHE